jgi:B12-binding domain/radical SAM domain protein of rhizo-twelve system
LKYTLINPAWTFDGSIYFGCQEPHLPLEYGYSKALLERAGHEVQILDGQLDNLSPREIARRAAAFEPDFLVIATAPSYLFWRCAPPELRVPQLHLRELDRGRAVTVAVGPHGSTTPTAALKKLGVDVVVIGECEEILPRLAGRWEEAGPICYWDGGLPRVQGAPHAADMAALPALRWPDETIGRHAHQHHRFDAHPAGPGAEMEASRGCPYRCTFCAKENFRNAYRKRPLPVILDELDALAAQGVEYVYFIDEIFLPNRELLEALADRPVKFGVQTRIDLWSRDMLELLGRAGCVSIEAGVESITEDGRAELDKKCRLSTDGLSALLIHARRFVPFVQGNLIETPHDDPEAVEAWRERLRENGVWSNKPVPLFPYPGSPDYTRLWGAPDERAWERAHEYYLRSFDHFSDIQEERPAPLVEIESPPGAGRR